MAQKLSKAALVVGVTGQDGAYLARLLLRNGFIVHGTSRDAGWARREGLKALGLEDRVQIHSLATSDFRSMAALIEKLQPSQIYNLSGLSSVGLSFEQPIETMESIVVATVNLLESLRLLKSDTRFYNAGSSEMFGDTTEMAADESTAIRPKSPYGIAKAAAVELVKNYRESYGLFACSGILFNHESPLRPQRFVTRKITNAAARIAGGDSNRLQLGRLSPKRDFGWAPDYVEAMYAMLNCREPEDFVIATGEPHSLEEFASAAFEEVGLDWRDHVDIDPTLRRPSDIEVTYGSSEKAKRLLRWRPKVGFHELIARMVRAETEGASAVS